MRARVVTRLEPYLVAIAELPESAESAPEAEGSIVVVDGQGDWCSAAADALARGAAAIIVSRPSPAPVGSLDALAAVVQSAPVILERDLLRADAVDLVRDSMSEIATPAVLAVECHAPRPQLGTALHDAIGWARVIAGARLSVRSGASSGGRVLGLLEAGPDAAVPVIAGEQPGAGPLGCVRVTTLAETRLEVEAARDVVVAVTDSTGRRVLPALFESPHRVALRRAIAAVCTGTGTVDLRDLRDDAAAVEALLATAGA